MIQERGSITTPSRSWYANGEEQPWSLIHRSVSRIAGAKTTGLPHHRHSQPSRRKTRTWRSFGSELLFRFASEAIETMVAESIAAISCPATRRPATSRMKTYSGAASRVRNANNAPHQLGRFFEKSAREGGATAERGNVELRAPLSAGTSRSR